MTAMTSHQTVLHWHESWNKDRLARFPSRTWTGPQLFVTADQIAANQYTEYEGTAVRLAYDTWQDMGGPTEITVTVQPGDLLNSDQP